MAHMRVQRRVAITTAVSAVVGEMVDATVDAAVEAMKVNAAVRLQAFARMFKAKQTGAQEEDLREVESGELQRHSNGGTAERRTAASHGVVWGEGR